MRNAHLPPHDGEIIILKTEPQKAQVSYTFGRKQGDKMIFATILIITIIFALISISPLLVTDEMHDIVKIN